MILKIRWNFQPFKALAQEMGEHLDYKCFFNHDALCLAYINQESETMAKNDNPQTGAHDNAFPLFFKDPVVISLQEHKDAKLRRNLDMSFTRSTNSIPLTVGDIVEAAKHYPVVFSMGEKMVPVAIVGLEKENYFVNEKNEWLDGRYVPAYVRKYPFIFSEAPEVDQLTLCIDRNALASKGEDGIAMYEGDSPAPFLNNALEFCKAYQGEYMLTQRFSETVSKLGLLRQQRSEVKFANGRAVELNGFQLVDIEKLQNLADKDVVDMHREGSLPLIYSIVQSQSNWQRLLDLGNRREPKKSA